MFQCQEVFRNEGAYQHSKEERAHHDGEHHAYNLDQSLRRIARGPVAHGDHVAKRHVERKCVLKQTCHDQFNSCVLNLRHNRSYRLHSCK